jgi:GDP-mannose 4,6-dehydratase
MQVVSNIDECRICKSKQLENVISLGEQYITSRFPKYGDFSTPKTCIDLCSCKECGLLQLLQTSNSSELYEYEYGYRSGISNTMRVHLNRYHTELLSKVVLSDGHTVVDIGSNDSTFLQYYPSSLKRIGIDPTGKQFEQYYGDVELIPTYFTYNNFKNVYGDLTVKVVTSISMFYDLPDPVQFAKDIYEILEPDGIWTCEQSYMPTMIKTNSIDTICHEHLEYYGLRQVKNIADRAGFKIIDVGFNDCNGGSFRVYFAKKQSSVYVEDIDTVNAIINQEAQMGFMDNSIYKLFMENCNKEIGYLCDFLKNINANGKKVYIYGASTKGNCLLQYAKIDEKQIKYAVERNPKKVGKMTSTGIEIISEETMRNAPPDFLLVLPWHFRTEILERESEFLNNGGQFIFPFPHFQIVGSKPKLLITGCDGMIAHYVKNKFVDYNLYGISRSLPKYEKSIMKFYFDMNDTTKLEYTLSVIKPDIIVHLASISSSHYAFNNPIETLLCNGLLISRICDIIHRNSWKTKLFNASSSEIYKGHIDYDVKEDDVNMYHLHPYSVAKIMGHSMVDFYRNTYGLPFFNGVIFTTESHMKSPSFLLNKVATHIKEWFKGNHSVLKVGSLDSYRNVLHASDVSTAIHTIIAQDKGGNYLICNEESHKVYELVLKLYSLSGIQVERRENILYDKQSGLPVMEIEENKIGFEAYKTNIRGQSTKLKKLGWKPTMTYTHILNELI